MCLSGFDHLLLTGDVIPELDDDYNKNSWGRWSDSDGCFSIRYKEVPDFVELLNLVYRSNNSGKKKVLEKLLSLPMSCTIELSGKISQHNLNVIYPKKFSFVENFDEFGISYFTEVTMDKEELLKRIISDAERYGKDSWIGFLENRETKDIDFLYIEI